MTCRLVSTALASTPPTPQARRAVGQLSSMLLIVALIGVVLIFGFLLIMLRRRSRAHSVQLRRKHADPGNAWAEAGARVPLEEDDSIPREPGSA